MSADCIPAPAIGGERDENLTVRGRRNVVQRQQTLPFVGTPLAEREETGETAIGGAVGRQAEQARRVGEIETGTDDEFEIDLLRRHVRSHDTGERVAIGDRERRQTERLGLRDQLMRMRAAAQEGEIGRHLQLRVGGRTAATETMSVSDAHS